MRNVIVLKDYFKKIQKEKKDLPHSWEKIATCENNGQLASATQFQIENGHFLKIELLSDELEWIKDQIGRGNLNINRTRFLLDMISLLEKFVSGKKTMYNNKHKDNMRLLYWFIEKRYRDAIEFELLTDDQIQVVVKQEYESIETILMLLNLIDILQDRKIVVGDLLNRI